LEINVSKIINALFFVLFMAFMAIVMVEWASGCGESYVDAAGDTHQHQCWIVK
jgi:hypothetical protein